MGLLSSLLSWHTLDPPSASEKLRNDRVCQLYQHNRNPFVDHPEFVPLIWPAAPPVNMTSALTSATPVNVESGLTGQPSSVREAERREGEGGRLREGNDVVAWINEIHYNNVGPDRNEVSVLQCTEGVVVLFVACDGDLLPPFTLALMTML